MWSCLGCQVTKVFPGGDSDCQMLKTDQLNED